MTDKCEHYTPWEGGDIQEEHDGSVRCSDCGRRWVPSDVLEEAVRLLERIDSEYSAHDTLASASKDLDALRALIDGVLGK